jgi:hypothetical protein
MIENSLPEPLTPWLDEEDARPSEQRRAELRRKVHYG